MKYRHDSPMKNMTYSEFSDFLLELPHEKVDAGLMDECFTRIVDLGSFCFDLHHALHFVIDCVEDKSRLDGLSINELCIEAGADGRKPMSIGERDLVFEDCEPFVTPFLPENFID
jgi:hypothetical protein